ncbi:MAG: F0F1 ATP synthase subunit epsilon [Psychroflexus sp.]|jgi:F-type H+-transporting ATPase subunit epsilon|nr:F0F1 ATP synthase subunit epsilon [Psychroflexus sp.]
MHLEIITPEEILLSQDQVTDVIVPGVEGEFQLLDHHAPIVSVLQEGDIIFGGKVELPKKVENKFKQQKGKYHYTIKGGVIENKQNKTIILVD